MGREEFIERTPVIIEAREGNFEQLIQLVTNQNVDVRHIIPTFNMVAAIVPNTLIGTLDGNVDVVQTVYFDDEVPVPTEKIGRERRLLSPNGLIGEISGIPFIGRVTGAVDVRPRDIITRSRFALSKRVRGAGLREGWIPTSQVRELVGANEARAEGIEGTGIKIAILDTGLPLFFARNRHPQMKDRFVQFPITRFPRPDRSGHGSHVATIAGGSKWTTRNGVTLEGIAPGAIIGSFKVLQTPLGVGRNSDIIKGMEMTIEWGADIVNMSLGSDKFVFDSPFETPLRMMIDVGMIPVAASGNAGPGPSTVGTPGGSGSVISVGSINTIGAVSGFSSRGPAGANTKPDVVGFGGDNETDEKIYSGTSPGSLLDKLDKRVADGKAPAAGTSQATPGVSGVLALIMEWHLREKGSKINFGDVGRMINQAGEPKNDDTGHGLMTYSWRNSL